MEFMSTDWMMRWDSWEVDSKIRGEHAGSLLGHALGLTTCWGGAGQKEKLGCEVADSVGSSATGIDIWSFPQSGLGGCIFMSLHQCVIGGMMN